MNRIILTFIIAFSTIYSYSQEEGEKEAKKKSNEEFVDEDKLFRIGIHTGPSFYIMNGASTENTNSVYKFAYNQDIALVFTAKFGKIFEAKTGIGYSSKNFKREEECLICGNDIVEGSNFRLNYLEIPLLANLYFYNSRLDVYGIVGIRNSILLSAKNKHRANVENDIETVFNVKEDFAKYLLGVQAGVGVNYNLTYALSLTGEFIYTYNPLVLEPATGLNFHALSLNLGINFKL